MNLIEFSTTTIAGIVNYATDVIGGVMPYVVIILGVGIGLWILDHFIAKR